MNNGSKRVDRKAKMSVSPEKRVKKYRVNEVFLTVQGEGIRAGTVAVFLRFTGCNLECDLAPGPKSPGGFQCDTEFASGRDLTRAELVQAVVDEAGRCRWVVVTGGEPGLQLDSPLIDALHDAGFKVAVETNGSIELPPDIDWVTVSPKVAEHAIKQLSADEVKYVRAYGQGIPKTRVNATHYILSPAFDGPTVNQRNSQWCLDLVKTNPTWRISLQEHKAAFRIR